MLVRRVRTYIYEKMKNKMTKLLISECVVNYHTPYFAFYHNLHQCLKVKNCMRAFKKNE